MHIATTARFPIRYARNKRPATQGRKERLTTVYSLPSKKVNDYQESVFKDKIEVHAGMEHAKSL